MGWKIAVSVVVAVVAVIFAYMKYSSGTEKAQLKSPSAFGIGTAPATALTLLVQHDPENQYLSATVEPPVAAAMTDHCTPSQQPEATDAQATNRLVDNTTLTPSSRISSPTDGSEPSNNTNSTSLPAAAATPQGPADLPPRETLIPGGQSTYPVRLLHFFPGEHVLNNTVTTESAAPTTPGVAANPGYVSVWRRVAEGFGGIMGVFNRG
ncbi:uncharacterized protein N7511_001484 [Penicillium nucicola]|uniref:uncharacterized protein n=1 Tax=Penicillium nucicola TaxID=1850975 RepID=UPI002545304B|nr:uncharacterized protein N7511_001484 [Penicillium nucicola]KAJ5776473.1 hypothetical protein N7511_001484 [Penicillium nucicola]